MPTWRTLVAPLLIVLVAIGYYGSYLRFWFNPHDEGGTAAFTAMRLLAGEAPIRDVELGYNVGWFWPIVALFKIGGVNFILMRAFFFGLSTLCAIWGWAVVRKATKREWLALLVGITLVVFPGSQFKNYIPMLCVANMLAITTAALASGSSAPRFWRRALIGGVVLGITLLIRIDLGYLFGLLWLGAIVLRCFDARTPAKGRVLDAVASAAVIVASVIILQLPVYAAARSGGYDGPFVAQYQSWFTFISGQAESVVKQRQTAVTPEALADVEAAPKALPSQASAGDDRATLQRVSWDTFRSFAKADKSVLFILTYLPVAILVVLVAWAAVSVLLQIFRRTFTLDHPAMIALLVLGASLTVFPQFYFFRPDRPHLAEFMPGYIVAVTTVLALIVGRWRWAVIAVFVIQMGLFGWLALDHYSAGTIAARINIKKNKRAYFDGQNGVDVWVHQKEQQSLKTIYDAVMANSKPGEWLICYPYQPGYNVMTDRPTYERELYQDNATAPAGWKKRAIARIEKFKPAVIIIDNRAINQADGSRFNRWAEKVYDHVRANYQLCATSESVEVYCRDSKPVPAPAPAEEANASNP